jgi:hypothetical protein
MSSNGTIVNTGRASASVQLACLSMDFQEASVMNLDHLIPNESTRVLGFMGWDAFKGFELQIDFRNKLLCLYKVDSYDPTGIDNLKTSPIQIVPFQFNGPLPCVHAKIGDEKLFLILDTGATVNVMRKSLYKRLTSYYQFLRMVKLRAWDSVFEAPLTEVSGVWLGEVPLDDMKTVWYYMSGLNETLTGPVIDGILGQELMKQYLLAINFTTLEIAFYNYDELQLGEAVSQVSELHPSNEN